MSCRRERKRRARSLVDALELRRHLAAHIVGGGTFATIQAAVNAASAGATINVDAGTYAEGVEITKSLTLRGARAGVDGRSNIRTDLAGESILTGFVFGGGTHSGAFAVEANNVVIDGFICQDSTDPNFPGAGISIQPNMFGTQIRNCVIQANILGLHLANSSATVPAIIEKNLFYNNNVVGNNYGRAIYSDGGISGGTLQNVLISNNAFLRNRGAGNIQAAIGLEAQTVASTQTNITISNNYFDTNGKALLAYNASNITFSGNTVGFCWDTTSAGLRFEGGTNNITISGNTLHNSEARAIRIDKKAFNGPNTGFTITGNNIFGNGQGVGQDDVNHDGLYIDAGMYTGTLNATNNWWGSASGPGGDGPGSGDKIFAHGNSVSFSGWATTPFQPLQKPYKGVAWSPLYRIEAEDFDHGNAGLAYNDTTAQNLDMFYRDYESPDLEPTTDVDGSEELYEIRSNEFLAYTIQVDTPGIYSGSFRVNTAQTTAARFHLEMSNASGGFDVVSSAYTITNTTNAWQTQTLNNINFASYGTKVLRIVFESAGSGTVSTRLNWFKFNLVTPTGPFAPTGLSAVPNGANINLSWTD